MRLDLHAQLARGARLRCADAAAVEAVDHHGVAASGEAHALLDGGDSADAREVVALARDEDDTLFIAGVDGQREGHVGEDDGVVDGNEKKCLGGHAFVTYLRWVSKA